MPPRRPLILIYNSYFGAWPDPVTLSLETRCRFTVDRRRLAEADYVVFHLPTMAAGDYPERRAGQRWIAWCRESSVNVPALSDPAFMDSLLRAARDSIRRKRGRSAGGASDLRIA